MSIGRVTNQMMSNASVARYNDLNTQMMQLQDQIATGKKVIVPSDDPVSASAILKYRDVSGRIDQYTKNVNSGTALLGGTDSAIQSVLSIQSQAKQLALENSQSSGLAGDGATIASQVDEMLNQTVSLANQQIAGQYLFAGSKNSAAPFQMVGGQFVEYTGDAASLQTAIGDGVNEAINVNGQEAFGALSAEVDGTVDLNPAVSRSTKLADLNSGRGVAAGSIRVVDGLGDDVTLDLSTAEDLGDVIDRFNHSALGQHLVAGLNSAGTGLSIAVKPGIGATTVQVLDLAGNTTAADLGIRQDAPMTLTPFSGANVNTLTPPLTPATLLSDLNAGAGVGSGSIEIVTGLGDDVTIDLSTAVTVGDVLNAINSSGVGGHLVASLNAAGNGIGLSLQPGTPSTTVRVLEVGVGATANDLGILQAAPFALSTLGGANLRPQLTTSTPLALLNGGAGIPQQGGIVITNGNDSVTYQKNVTFQGLSTVEDLINAVNGAGVYATAKINAAGTGIDIVSRLNGAGLRVASFADGGTVTAASAAGMTTLTDATKSFTPGALAGATLTITGFGGAATAAAPAGTSTLTDATKTFSPNVLIGATITITGGSGVGQTAVVTGNTANTITVATPWGTALDNTSTYRISGAIQSTTITGNTATSLTVANPWITGLDNTTTYQISGNAASQLGLQSFNAGTAVTSLNNGAGVRAVDATAFNGDMTFTLRDGTTFNVSVAGATSMQDILNDINAGAPGKLTASIQPVQRTLPGGMVVTQNGIVLSDTSGGNGSFSIQAINGSVAGIDLGLIPAGTSNAKVTASAAAPTEIAGIDVNPVTSASIFTALAQLKSGLIANDINQVAQAGTNLDIAQTQLLKGQSLVGSREKRLTDAQSQLTDQGTQMQKLISALQDVNLAEAITKLSSLQTSYQAFLAATANTSKTTLASYL